MARTDKDAPDWVRATWWEPDHYACDQAIGTRWGYRGSRRVCDLPDAPVRRRPVRYTWRARHHHSCTWIPDTDEIHRAWYEQGAPGWFCSLEWHRPRRRMVRDQLTAARADYRAGGDADLEVDVAQHRHCATWLYW